MYLFRSAFKREEDAPKIPARLKNFPQTKPSTDTLETILHKYIFNHLTSALNFSLKLPTIFS